MSAIQFRPHHFLCALCFQGAGYSPSFIRNFKKIMETLSRDEKTEITVVSHTDSICAPCPHRTDLTCTSQEKINQLDQAHATVLDIHPNSTITWEDAKKKIAERLSLEDFHQMCAPCEWKKFGMCEEVVRKTIK